MNFYSNTTTRRLEAVARRNGHRLGIVKSPDNSAGVFFVASVDGRPLTRWAALGWTVAEARENVERWGATLVN